MNILSVLQLLGGVGLFLYGMNLMGSSLKTLAGGKLSKILERLTTSKKKGVGEIKGWALGTGVTGIIQSSAATTIMLIGFVNAGIMSLAQAIPVVFGANVGSTVTAQILRLGDLGAGSIILQLLKPSSFAPLLVGISAFILLFSNNKKMNNIAGIMIGLGILFYGMTTMESVFEPLRESPEFRALFTAFSNPLIGILTGILITALIQSSSASVGILQALSATGIVTYSIMFPYLIGQNIGKCLTVILGSIGATKNAKRVSVSYLLFNILQAVGFTLLIYGIYYTVGIPFFDQPVNRGIIANFHLGTNLITSLVLLPFCSQMAKLTEKMVGKDTVDDENLEFSKLDDMLLNTPTVALDQCHSLILHMIDCVMKNFSTATELLGTYDEKAFEDLDKNESFIDRCETELTAYIIRIDRKKLPDDYKKMVGEMLNSISDLERIGDYAMRIAYYAQEKHEKNIHFTQVGNEELHYILYASNNALESALVSFRDNDLELAYRVQPLEQIILEMKNVIKEHHVERLQEGICSVESGVALFDLLNCFERIASHAANISLHVIKRLQDNSSFDEMHGHSQQFSGSGYDTLVTDYQTEFLEPLQNEEVE